MDSQVKTAQVLRSQLLAKQPWLVHGFSTRQGGYSNAYGMGELNLGFTDEDDRKNVERNRELFIRELEGAGGGTSASASSWELVNLRQIHSDVIYCVDNSAKKLAPGDGMITKQPRTLLAIRTADCLPILIADPERRAVGAFHAGWRGTLGRIAEKGVGAMRREFGSMPKNLVAAIGPGIHGCCYAVGAEVREQFESQFEYAADLFREVHDADAVRKKYPLMFMNQRAPGHGDAGPELHLDLVEANRRQLLAAGLRAENIEASELCTACRTELLFSHRAEHGKTGRMFGAIGIK